MIVEDEPEIQELLAVYLRGEGYAVTAVGDGWAALEQFQAGAFDLVLLDVLLPGLDGFGVCQRIRQEADTPVIMLTALDGEAEQLRGFDLRIDDYVTKPFSMPVLLRKIAAVLRRAGGREDAALLRYRDLVLDLDSRECRAAGVEVRLTQREFDLLAELLRAPGRVLTREVLLGLVWSYDFLGDTRIVDSHIKNLRKKLPLDCIETIRGVGYRAAKEAKY